VCWEAADLLVPLAEAVATVVAAATRVAARASAAEHLRETADTLIFFSGYICGE
jgi:hypothetical protein